MSSTNSTLTEEQQTLPQAGIPVVTERLEKDWNVYVTASCGKTTATVSIRKDGSEIRVIVENAAHRVWRGSGRAFPNAEQALAHYKSAAVQQIIRTAVASTF
jgi:ribosomal protein L31